MVTQTHKLIVANQSDHDEATILTKYLVLGLPAGCTVNGLPGGSIEVFSDSSSYTAGQKKTFNVTVTYACNNDPSLIGSPFQLRLVVDHGGDDYPNPDDEDVVDNNSRTKSKFIK